VGGDLVKVQVLGVLRRERVQLCENVEVKPDRRRTWWRPDLVICEQRLLSTFSKTLL
jgi:hypothetical protein